MLAGRIAPLLQLALLRPAPSRNGDQRDHDQGDDHDHHD
jgi:hypothetical protein